MAEKVVITRRHRLGGYFTFALATASGKTSRHKSRKGEFGISERYYQCDGNSSRTFPRDGEVLFVPSLSFPFHGACVFSVTVEDGRTRRIVAQAVVMIIAPLISN